MTGAASWLVLPVTLLLFLQWPLRDVIQAWSREANDLAQWLFALYVSVALTATSRARAHLAADAFAQRHSAATPTSSSAPAPCSSSCLGRSSC